jgi:Flp pilus assembly pilin Flp
MLRIFRNKKAQTTAEYAILIGLVVAALVAMQTYVKRGLQGRMKDATDQVAIQNPTIGATSQYEPYYMQQGLTTTTTGSNNENVATGGAITRTDNTTSGRTGSQTYGW